MPIMDINGRQVHVHDTAAAKAAAEYLLKNKENADAFFQAAHHDHINKMHHFEVPHHEHPNLSHHMTLIHTGHDQYELRTQHGY